MPGLTWTGRSFGEFARRAPRGGGAALGGIAGLILCVGLACGGGGGGGGGGGPVQPPLPSLTFTPAGAATAGSVSIARTNGVDITTLVVEIRVREVPGLYGAAFDLTYPAGILRYDSAAEGTFLSAGATPTTFQVATAGTDRLIVGISRLGTAPGVASGEGSLVTLQFTAIAAGTGTFTFSANRGFDAAGAALPAAWVAGSVTVVR